MKILVFTEGTVIMHSSAQRLTKEQRVEQSKKRPRPLPVDFFKEEVPNGNAVEKLQSWKNQGAEIFYLTSRTTTEQVADIRNVLKKYNFPDNHNLLFRKEGEQYKNVAERLMPDILVEDDCESIGGVKEMTYTHIKPELKKKIKSVVVKEFGGINHLPDKLEELIRL
jgi:hypothetical protein